MTTAARLIICLAIMLSGVALLSQWWDKFRYSMDLAWIGAVLMLLGIFALVGVAIYPS